MSNRYYDKGLDKFCTGDIDWVNDSIYVSPVFLDEYTPDFANDEFLSSIPEAAIPASGAIDGKYTSGDGVMDGDDVLLVSVPGDGVKEANALVIWKNTGNRITSALIAYIDEGTQFPFVPNGGNISIMWSDDVNKILTLQDKS